MLAERIKELASEIHHKVVEDRPYLHAHPELSFAEFNTSAFVKQTLSEIGIPDKVYVEGTIQTLDEQWRKDAHTRMQDLTS